MNRKTILLLSVAVLAPLAGLAGVLMYFGAQPPLLGATESLDPGADSIALSTSNVHMEGETQIVEIQAKGYYSPLRTQAKAGVPTIIRIVTNDTFDCTSIVAIPSLKYQVRLPLSGSTDIALAAQPAGTTVTGLCGMAMYSFDIEFSA
jgi:hypothetical protein